MYPSAMPFDHTQLCHVLPQPRMLELDVGKGPIVHKLTYAFVQGYEYTSATVLHQLASTCRGVCSREL